MRFRSSRRDVARRLRRQATPTERYVWRLLRDRRMLGFRFRRQHPIGPFVVDFYCAELKLVLELDGEEHQQQQVSAHDTARSDWLVRRGYRVRRLANRAATPERLRDVIAAVASTGMKSRPVLP